MAEAAKTHNKGVLPAEIPEFTSGDLNMRSSVVSGASAVQAAEESNDATIELPPDEYTSADETAEYPREYTHVRSPELRRGELLILMSAAAVCGAVGGVILALSGKADPYAVEQIANDLSKDFGGIFLQRLMIGAAFLLIEYILGFFALGDILVWTAPLCCAMGLSLRIAVTESWVLIPSAVVTIAAVVTGAAVSSGFSRALMKLSRGGTVHLESSPRQRFTLNFLLYLAAVIAAAIYEGAILSK